MKKLFLVRFVEKTVKLSLSSTEVGMKRPAVINSMERPWLACCCKLSQKPKINKTEALPATRNSTFLRPKTERNFYISFQKTSATLVLIPLVVHFINII